MFCANIIRHVCHHVKVVNGKQTSITVATNGVQVSLSKWLSNMSTTGNIGSAKPIANNTLKAESEDNIVWLDLELTGLDPNKDSVLEVACLVTDAQLNVLAEGPDLVIHQPQHVLDNMNDWSTKQHAESGLTNRCKTSSVTLQDAERQLLDYVRQWTPYKKCPLGGNTIYMDRFFLMKHMPEFEQHMHYRIIDVSSVKELCRRWYADVYELQPNKKELCKHRAISDIKATIEELKFYRSKIFRQAEIGEAMGMSWC